MNDLNYRNSLYRFVKKNGISKHLFILYFISFAVILYFVFCAFFGEKGLIEFLAIQNQIESKADIKNNLSNKVKEKRNMVDGMNLNSLDLDMLDEKSREVLGYVGKKEVVIYRDK